MAEEKSVYICGPLTGLDEDKGKKLRRFYEEIADLCEELFGVRAFVPHEHYDPIANPNATPEEINHIEREQVTKKSLCLIAVADEDSWGGGIEVEMAWNAWVPVILVSHVDKRVSRLLRGNPSILKEVKYFGTDDALDKIAEALEEVLVPTPVTPST